MKHRAEIESNDDMDMLPAWATPVILAFMMAVGPAIHSLDKKPVKPQQPKPICQLHLASAECK